MLPLAFIASIGKTGIADQEVARPELGHDGVP